MGVGGLSEGRRRREGKGVGGKGVSVMREGQRDGSRRLSDEEVRDEVAGPTSLVLIQLGRRARLQLTEPWSIVHQTVVLLYCEA